MFSLDLSAESPEESEPPESLGPEDIRRTDNLYVTSSVRSLKLMARQLADVEVVPGVARWGSVVVARVVTVGSNVQVEDQEGENMPLLPEDWIVGVTGNRYSTTEWYGGVPAEGITVPTEKQFDLLSSGGVIGICDSYPSYAGRPTKLQILGLLAQSGKPVNLLSQLHTAQHLTYGCSLILIAGTAAGVGKTTFATKLIEFLIHEMQWHVAATKIAGAGEYADLLSLYKAGAEPALDFVDAGLPTTYDVPDRLVVPTIKGVLNRIGETQPDVVIAELGGDILGASVPDILADPEIRAITKALILVPSDMLAAYGAMNVLRDSSFPAPIYLGQPIRNPEASRERARMLLKRPMFDSMKKEDLSNFVKGELGWKEKSRRTGYDSAIA